RTSTDTTRWLTGSAPQDRQTSSTPPRDHRPPSRPVGSRGRTRVQANLRTPQQRPWRTKQRDREHAAANPTTVPFVASDWWETNGPNHGKGTGCQSKLTISNSSSNYSNAAASAQPPMSFNDHNNPPETGSTSSRTTSTA